MANFGQDNQPLQQQQQQRQWQPLPQWQLQLPQQMGVKQQQQQQMLYHQQIYPANPIYPANVNSINPVNVKVSDVYQMFPQNNIEQKMGSKVQVNRKQRKREKNINGVNNNDVIGQQRIPKQNIINSKIRKQRQFN